MGAINTALHIRDRVNECLTSVVLTRRLCSRCHSTGSSNRSILRLVIPFEDSPRMISSHYSCRCLQVMVFRGQDFKPRISPSSLGLDGGDRQVQLQTKRRVL